jgi:hypothetical protein
MATTTMNDTVDRTGRGTNRGLYWGIGIVVLAIILVALFSMYRDRGTSGTKTSTGTSMSTPATNSGTTTNGTGTDMTNGAATGSGATGTSGTSGTGSGGQ